MNRNTIIAFMVLASLFLGLIMVYPVQSSAPQTVYIKPDGSIYPSSAPIRHTGGVYILTSDIKSQLIIETDNVILDGAGHTFEGSGGGVAINMTCSNVTVENVRLVNWTAGVLGVFNNNTVVNCVITQCESAIKIYAQYYVVVDNEIDSNGEGIHIGQGGYNFIADNNITNNPDGFYLYDSNNQIIQNTIENCSQSALTFDAAGWSQTIYHNNFINNKREVVDYTYSNGRPWMFPPLPWDNGSTGNYWSDYVGTDLNGNGIGDIPYQIPTYLGFDEAAPYNYIDRYPITIPFNINSPMPPINLSLTSTPSQRPASSVQNQALALSFLKNVIGLETSSYTATLTHDIGWTPSTRIPSEYLSYNLVHISSNGFSETTASMSIIISNSSVISFALQPTGGQLIYSYPVKYDYSTAQKIMQNYQEWTHNEDVGKMVSMLNMAGSTKNSTQQQNNIELTVSILPDQSTYSWSYNYNGADYSKVSLAFHTSLGFAYIYFSDTRNIYRIGDTAINISQKQAIQIAENFVSSYSYPLNFGNGTIADITDLTINATGTTSNLTSASQSSITLLPCWVVQVPLDHVYPEKTEVMTVNIWAGNGTVFNVERNVVPLPVSYSKPFQGFNPLLLIWVLSVFVVALVTITAILLIYLFRSNPEKKLQNYV